MSQVLLVEPGLDTRATACATYLSCIHHCRPWSPIAGQCIRRAPCALGPREEARRPAACRAFNHGRSCGQCDGLKDDNVVE